jgi:FixJ family two-component response regulator
MDALGRTSPFIERHQCPHEIIAQDCPCTRCIIADFEPGDLNGFNLARIAQANDPNIAVMIVAGALPHGFSGVALDARFLTKPYRMTDVIRLIRESAEDQSYPG